MRTTIVVIILAVAIVTPGVGAAQTPAVPSDQDGAIATEIERRLAADKQVNAQTVDIDVRGGIVTLKGRVPDEDAKERADHLADGVPGVKEVQNKLLVGNPDTPGSIPDEMPGAK
jgi:osmotically-inducible protein OsmY